jgi:sec-independent protein translocase protein TatA
MPNLGATELIIILVIVIAVFGAGKLPELGGALGKGVKEFKSATREVESASNDAHKAVEDATADHKA